MRANAISTGCPGGTGSASASMCVCTGAGGTSCVRGPLCVRRLGLRLGWVGPTRLQRRTQPNPPAAAPSRSARPPVGPPIQRGATRGGSPP